MKKDQSRFVEDQAKEALNFQITALIAYVAAGLLSCAGVGVFLYPITGVGVLVFSIMAAIKANDGVLYRYPVSWRLIK